MSAVWLLAVALGLDAFSVGVGVGAGGVRVGYALKLGTLVALMHALLPLAGMAMGEYAGRLLGTAATFAGGAVLALLGVHMMAHAFGRSRVREASRGNWSAWLLAAGVSVDAMSVGFSLGLAAADAALTAALFGVAGGAMAMAGLLLGGRLGRWAGDYGEALGGVMLLAFGLRMIW